MSVKGTVTSFDEWTLWGTVSYDLSSERFHSTSYSGRGWPYVGAKVEIVYNDKGQLLAVHEIDAALSTLDIALLGLSNEAAAKLAELNIRTVEAFSSRVSDPNAIERIRLHIGANTMTMSSAVTRALQLAPPAQPNNRVAGGALVRNEMNDGAHIMDHPDGPQCRCGQPSAHESGWCGVCEV